MTRPTIGRVARLARIANMVWGDCTLTAQVKPDHVRIRPEK